MTINTIGTGLGKNRNHFLLVGIALVLNFILMLCKTIHFNMSGFAKGNYAIVSFCKKMSDFVLSKKLKAAADTAVA